MSFVYLHLYSWNLTPQMKRDRFQGLPGSFRQQGWYTHAFCSSDSNVSESTLFKVHWIHEKCIEIMFVSCCFCFLLPWFMLARLGFLRWWLCCFFSHPKISPGHWPLKEMPRRLAWWVLGWSMVMKKSVLTLLHTLAQGQSCKLVVSCLAVPTTSIGCCSPNIRETRSEIHWLGPDQNFNTSNITAIQSFQFKRCMILSLSCLTQRRSASPRCQWPIDVDRCYQIPMTHRSLEVPFLFAWTCVGFLDNLNTVIPKIISKSPAQLHYKHAWVLDWSPSCSQTWL